MTLLGQCLDLPSLSVVKPRFCGGPLPSVDVNPRVCLEFPSLYLLPGWRQCRCSDGTKVSLRLDAGEGLTPVLSFGAEEACDKPWSTGEQPIVGVWFGS